MNNFIAKITMVFLLALALNSSHARINPLNNLGDCSTNDGNFNSEEGGCLDFSTGLVWSLGSSRAVVHSEAVTYCNDLTESKFEDWNLPSKTALAEAAADRKASTYFAFKINSPFWAADDSNSADAWLVNLSTGELTHDDRTASSGARVCVRAPQDMDRDHVPDSSDHCNLTPSGARVWTFGKYKGCAHNEVFISVIDAQRKLQEAKKSACRVESDYFSTADGGCKDKRAGGRVWSFSTGESIDRTAADRYCGGLLQGQKQGWRLPTSDEIIAVSGRNVAGAHFNFDADRTFWSSTVTMTNSGVNDSMTTAYNREAVSMVAGKKYTYVYRVTTSHANPKWNSDYLKNTTVSAAVVCVR